MGGNEAHASRVEYARGLRNDGFDSPDSETLSETLVPERDRAYAEGLRGCRDTQKAMCTRSIRGSA